MSHVLPGMQEKAACDFDKMVNTAVKGVKV
jgi:hypothetical protein